MYIADLHIHSKYSRATSRDCDAPNLDLWARRKGIGLVGTGDFTHPAWREELKEALVPAEDGFYTLKDEYRQSDETANQGPSPRFVVTGEISTIYKKDGRTRKVHSLILLPGLEAAEELSRRLETIGNIRSDGRPILGLDCRDLLEITLSACPEAVFIPAHIWTPHFSVFGAFSGFSTIEECFGDLSGEIHALETGLSSDPPMNWRVSALDGFSLVSNSDAHSPGKLGREANLMDCGLSYYDLARALKTGNGLSGTLEFFPEEGKYHLDGHRNCNVRLTPEETAGLNGLCPVCGKKVTIGVQHRVVSLADRPEGFVKPDAKGFESLVPLPELIAASAGVSKAGKETLRLYAKMLRELGPEFKILREIPTEDAERSAGPLVAEGIRRMRAGEIIRAAGYDGEYGVISVFAPGEREALTGQTALFRAEKPGKKPARPAVTATDEGKTDDDAAAPGDSCIHQEELNEEQLAAVTAPDRAIAVIAGPGTGKTKTLVARIEYLIEKLGVKPDQIAAVTFTNQAAGELRGRLETKLGKKAVRGITVGTFHAVCLGLLDPKPILGEVEALQLIKTILAETGGKTSPQNALQAISRAKNGVEAGLSEADEAVFKSYAARCAELGVRDLDDLLLDALKPEVNGSFRQLLVDEFQDASALQRKLIRKWSAGGESLFAIGDPDQSIYGFRGADARCFTELEKDFPGLKTIALEKNYRSSGEILRAANRVISNNPGGERQASAMRKTGGKARLIGFDTPFSESVWIAKEIARMTGGTDMLEAGEKLFERDAARPFSDVAVLCRTRRQLELIESCLRHDSIPCVVFGRGDFLQEDAVCGALAFFRFMLGGNNASALSSCLELTWGLTRKEAAKIASAVVEEHGNSALSPALGGAGCPAGFLQDAEEYAPRVKKEKPAKLLQSWALLHGGGEPMERLIAAAAFHRTMEDLLSAAVLGGETDLRRASGKSYASGAVSLLTLHGAKGLEFPAVFLSGVNAGELPLVRAERPSDIEEERRLFFVGMTRAKDELIITRSGSPSPFLTELPDDLKAAARTDRRSAQDRQLSLF